MKIFSCCLVALPMALGSVSAWAEATSPETAQISIPNEPVRNELEIERKFLVNPKNLPKDMAQRSHHYDIVQTYISYSPEIRVRRIKQDLLTWYTFTLKLAKDTKGLSRQEIEFVISDEEYRALLKKREGATIYKTRYQFEENTVSISVDVYSGSLQGLVVAEVEFKSVSDSEQFTPPPWSGKDVTSDKRYKNAWLSKNPLQPDMRP